MPESKASSEVYLPVYKGAQYDFSGMGGHAVFTSQYVPANRLDLEVLTTCQMGGAAEILSKLNCLHGHVASECDELRAVFSSTVTVRRLAAYGGMKNLIGIVAKIPNKNPLRQIGISVLKDVPRYGKLYQAELAVL